MQQLTKILPTTYWRRRYTKYDCTARTQRLLSHMFSHAFYLFPVIFLPPLVLCLPFSQSPSLYIKKWNAVRNITSTTTKRFPSPTSSQVCCFASCPLPFFPRSLSSFFAVVLIVSEYEAFILANTRGRKQLFTREGHDAACSHCVLRARPHTQLRPLASGRKHPGRAAPPVDGTSE